MRKASEPFGRLASIDVLRAVAIVLMVLVHFVENLSETYSGDNAFTGRYHHLWMATECAAPIFTFLAGVSHRLWSDQQRRRGWNHAAIVKATVRRGLFLFGLGLAFNVFVWLPEDVFNWDILTLIGSAILVLAAIRRAPDAAIVMAAGLAIAVAPVMRHVSGFSEFWMNDYFDYDFTFSDVVTGFLVTGYFPVFPWLAFPLIGYTAAPRLVSARWGMVGIGTGLVGCSAGMATCRSIQPDCLELSWTMFPASTTYVLGTLGLVLLAVAILHQQLDGDGSRCPRLIAWATPLSRHALSIYLLHHVAHVWPLWTCGLLATGNATVFWKQAMPTAAALAFSVVFLVIAAWMCRWADRRKVPTIESCMRWICE